MPRCQMCDHNDTVPSIYESSLITNEPPGRVRFYPEVGMELCWRCQRDSKPVDILTNEAVDPGFVIEEWDEVEEGELPVLLLDDEDFS